MTDVADLAAAGRALVDANLYMTLGTADEAGRPSIRIRSVMPDSADVAHHPFQAEIDELVACILANRETALSVFDAQKTMEVCLAADLSAEHDGRRVALPMIAD